MLPIPGEVIVKKNDIVKADAVVARTQIPSDVITINVVNILGIEPEDIYDYMLKKEKDVIQQNEPIAQNRPLIKWFKTVVKSPITGMIDNISNITGQVIIRKPPRLLELKAYIDGIVREVISNAGIVIETEATFIQGILGVGGETYGELKVVCNSPDDVLSADQITDEHKDKIIVGGSFTDYNALKKAIDEGVKGVIVGGINAKDLNPLLGYELGVAVTGDEDIPLTLILTEGLGKIAMANRTFELLKLRDGSRASISGRTQIRAGVMRPEIIIPITKDMKEMSTPKMVAETGVKEGDEVRIIREPYFGRLGHVKALPPDLREIETGAKVRIMDVELIDGTVVTVPRANVELIEA
jgi:hypothetical protein